MKIRLFRIIYFIWIIIPAGLYLTYLILGLPHVIWSYSWLDQGQGHDPFAYRYYTRCTFVGSYGVFTTHPTNGKCPWFQFFKERERG